MFFYFWNKSIRLVNEVVVFVVFFLDLNKVNFMKIVFFIGKLCGIFFFNIWMYLFLIVVVCDLILFEWIWIK